MEQQAIFIEMILKAWNIQVNRTDAFFKKLSYDDFYKPVAPGKNRIIYLLGHLVAIHDNMVSILGLGERSFAQLDEPFVKSPDTENADFPSPEILLQYWEQSNRELNTYFSQMTPDDWFSKHTLLSEEDFRKEPARNKLSVLITRTNHLAYHLGQMILILKK